MPNPQNLQGAKPENLNRRLLVKQSFWNRHIILLSLAAQWALAGSQVMTR